MSSASIRSPAPGQQSPWCSLRCSTQLPREIGHELKAERLGAPEVEIVGEARPGIADDQPQRLNRLGRDRLADEVAFVGQFVEKVGEFLLDLEGHDNRLGGPGRHATHLAP